MGWWRQGIKSPEDQNTGQGGPPGVSGPRADRLRLGQHPPSLLAPWHYPGAAHLRPGGVPGSPSEHRRPHEHLGWGCALCSLTPLLLGTLSSSRDFLETGDCFAAGQRAVSDPISCLASGLAGGTGFLRNEPPASAFLSWERITVPWALSPVGRVCRKWHCLLLTAGSPSV